MPCLSDNQDVQGKAETMKASQWILSNGNESPASMLRIACALLIRGTSANYYTVLSDMIVLSDISTNTYLEITTIKKVDFTMRNSVFCDLIYRFFHYSKTDRF